MVKGIFFKGMANTLYPIFGLSYLVGGGGDLYDPQKELVLHDD